MNRFSSRHFDQLGRSTYSVNRLARLSKFGKTEGSTKLRMAVLLGAPAPAIVAMMLLETIPLRPPSDGVDKSVLTWIRSFLFSMIVSFTLLLQLQMMIPRIRIRWWQQILLSTSSSLTTVLTMLFGAIHIGYPLPFAVNVGTPSYVVAFFGGVLLVYGKRWRKVVMELRQFIILLIFQSTSLFIYPALIIGFSSVPRDAQIAYTFLIPLTKYLLKQILKRILLQFPDLSALFVIMNAEVYHALFVSVCMQNSTSPVATLLLIAVDVGFVVLTILSLQRQVKSIVDTSLQREAGHSHAGLIETALYLLHDPKVRQGLGARQLTKVPTVRPRFKFLWTSVVPSPTGIQVTAAASDTTDSNQATAFEGTEQNDRFEFGHVSVPHMAGLDAHSVNEHVTRVCTTLQLLHRTEMFLLAEYVEVVVPIIYCIYLATIFHLPNRVYHEGLENLTVDAMRQMTTTVLGYAFLQLLTFLPLGWILKRQLGFHAMDQLVFALSSDWPIVVAKMTTWLLFTMQGSLRHNGIDYSFKFAWLHAKP